MALVCWGPHTGRNNGDPVIAAKLLVGFVEHDIQPFMPGYTGLQVIRDNDPADSFEIGESLDMRIDPGFSLLIRTQFPKEMHAVWQGHDKHGDRLLFACRAVCNPQL